MKNLLLKKKWLTKKIFNWERAHLKVILEKEMILQYFTFIIYILFSGTIWSLIVNNGKRNFNISQNLGYLIAKLKIATQNLN